MTTNTYPLVSIVTPAYNQAEYLAETIESVLAQDYPNLEYIVLDDGSTDHTAEIARRHGAKVIRHLTNLGAGAATVTGMQAAKVLDADVIVTIDADGQHNPADIQFLVECLLDGPYDVVIGSRLLDPAGMPASRFAANLLLNAVTYLVHGKIVSDSQSGFKAYSRGAIEAMALSSSGYEICSEIIGEIYRKNLRYKSVPIKAVYTDYSKAKGQHFLNGINLIIGLLMRMLRRA